MPNFLAHSLVAKRVMAKEGKNDSGFLASDTEDFFMQGRKSETRFIRPMPKTTSVCLSMKFTPLMMSRAGDNSRLLHSDSYPTIFLIVLLIPISGMSPVLIPMDESQASSIMSMPTSNRGLMLPLEKSMASAIISNQTTSQYKKKKKY
mgnify:CR=1 FL=1